MLNLQKHFFAISEWFTTLGTSGTGRVEVIVFSGLKNFAGNESVTVRALYPEQSLKQMEVLASVIIQNNSHVKWGSDDRTSPVFKWYKCVRSLNGLFTEWHLNI